MSTIHIRLAAPDPETSPAMRPQRAPVLERLLARGSRAGGTDDWRGVAFRVIAADGAPVPAVGAAALYACHGVAPAAWVCIASPVQLLAGMSDLTLAPEGILTLEPAEATLLAQDFNGVFAASGARLWVGRSGTLLCGVDCPLQVTTCEPAAAVGGDVFSCQPTGPDAARLRRLMSEIEMWLFEHAVNRLRSSNGRPVITGLWLWGGGAALTALPAVRGWTAGEDPLFAAFGNANAYPVAAARDAAARDWAPGVLVCADSPRSTAWPEFERRWLLPLEAAVRARRVERLQLSYADRLVVFDRVAALRFWKRAQPWWETLGGATLNGTSRGSAD